jgi:hypothetical protein
MLKGVSGNREVRKIVKIQFESRAKKGEIETRFRKMWLAIRGWPW